MSKYELKYRVIKNCYCNDFNNELKYTLVAVDYDPKTDLIRQRGFSGWGKHNCDLFSSKTAAEKWLCELNYNTFLNDKKELNEKIAELEKALELACRLVIEQEIDNESYYDIVSEWKEKVGIEEVGITNEILALYFKTKAKEELKNEN